MESMPPSVAHTSDNGVTTVAYDSKRNQDRLKSITGRAVRGASRSKQYDNKKYGEKDTPRRYNRSTADGREGKDVRSSCTLRTNPASGNCAKIIVRTSTGASRFSIVKRFREEIKRDASSSHIIDAVRYKGERYGGTRLQWRVTLSREQKRMIDA